VTTSYFPLWRRVHLTATWILALLAVVHIGVTLFIHSSWSPDAVWFLGTGLGLLLLAAMNRAHLGVEPCSMPTARVVRWANWMFAAFGIAAVLAVPEPQAMVILLALLGQAVASQRTLLVQPEGVQPS
jgi:hypothetical protein